MPILPQENDFWNNPNQNNFQMPLILINGSNCLYFLIKDIHKELEHYITTGKTETTELHVFPKKMEQLMEKQWAGQGLITTRHSQQVDYMHIKVSITYLKVRNPENKNNMSISLLPWFLLPNRPYPVFLYIFAINHYYSTDKKSLSQTAAAAGKLFGVKGLNKSTVSRSIKALEDIFEASQINRPLAVDDPKESNEGLDSKPQTNEEPGPKLPTNEELIKLIPEILGSAPSNKPLEERYKGMVKTLPTPINRSELVRCALSGIPSKCSKVIKDKEAVIRKARDNRVRPPLSRKGSKHMQRNLEFVDSLQCKQIRKDFIGICRSIVLDMAVSYHRFLV
jgi:hypothetical protein